MKHVRTRRPVSGWLVGSVLVALAGCNFGKSTDGSGIDASFEAGAATLDSSVPVVDAGPGAPDAPSVPDATPEAAAGFAIGGQVTGLVGSGLVLRDNGGDDLPIASDGTFVFLTRVSSGSPYAVTASTQPSHPTQTCAVSGATGTATADVTNVAVACATSTYTVGGTVIGLAAGSTGGVVLVDTLAGGATDTVTVNQNGSFTFPTKVASGSTFQVSVQSGPKSPPQTCDVSGATGTIVAGAVTSVVVNCAANAFVLGGTVTGLDGQGLVLQSGSTTVAVTSNGSFAFPSAFQPGTPYVVTVQSQPTSPSQTCSVTGGSGSIGNADVASVSVSCATNAFPVGGTVSGLAGNSVTLQDDGGAPLVVSSNGTFSFPDPVTSGTPYAVTVQGQPTQPWETCTVTAGAGAVGNGPVTGVVVACSPNQYPVQVTASGVTGQGLTLTLDSVTPLTVPGSGSFSFSSTVASGATFSVAVSAQPTNPTQVCTVTGGTGTVGGAPVAVAVACSTQAYSLGGSVSGLLGTGLVVTENGGDAVALAPGATTLTFPTAVASGTAFDVEIATQPTGPSQTCTVSGNRGTVVGGPVTSVVVNCGTNTFTVGGTVSGLAGSGLVLQNGTATVAVTAQGSFAFPPITSGATYDVTVATQPTGPSQTCAVTGGTGTLGGANVTDVKVTCVTRSFTVGGTVNGLAGGGLVLEDNGGDALPVTASGAFAFATAVPSGSSYSVTVKTQPTSPSQTCTPSSASGTVGGANVTSAVVGCTTNQYQVSASVTGLAGAGLTLTLNGSSPTSVTANGTYTLGARLASGSSYVVAVQTQPTNPSQTCTVAAPSASVGGSDVTVSVACTTSTFKVGGSVIGLTGGGLVLTNSTNGDTVTVPAGATSFALPKSVASGQTYYVAATTQPTNPTQTCSVTGGSGSVGAGPVTSITVNCQTQTYTIGGTVSVAGGGALGSGLAVTNGAETIHLTSTGSFAFQTPVASGATYAVTVTGQPASPTQSCVVTNASGTVVSANVNDVTITCTTASFTVGGTVSGLATGASVVLEDNGGDDLTVTAAGTFAFKTPIASGGAYSVTVKTQPTSPWQTCALTANAGTVGASAVTTVQITCTTLTETVSGTVSGLTGTGLTLVLSGSGLASSETVAVPANATNFAFTSHLPSGSTYAVAAAGKPQSPSQTCAVGNSSGTVQGAAVTGVTVTCTVDSFTVGGSIAGLTGTGMVLTDNGGDTLTPSPGQTSFAFATKLASGRPYSVVIQTQPGGQSCTVSGGSASGGSGTVGNGAVSLTVNCTSFYTVSGQISGLNGSGLQLSDGKDTIAVATGANSFSFPTPLVSGSTYSLSVVAQPTSYWDSCTISPTGTQTITASVSNVVVTCTPISGKLNLTLVNNGGAAFSSLYVVAGSSASNGTTVGGGLSQSGTFTIPSGSPYAVVASPPAGLTCAVTGNVSGTMGNPAVPLAVNVTCNVVTFTYSITIVDGNSTNPPCSSLEIDFAGAVGGAFDMSAGGTRSVSVPYSKQESIGYPGGGPGTCTCSTTPGNPFAGCPNYGCAVTPIDSFAYQNSSATLYCAVLPPPG